MSLNIFISYRRPWRVRIDTRLDLVKVPGDGKGEYLTIRLHGVLSETLVFPRKPVERSTAELMADHGIARRGTEDTMAV